MKSYRNDLAASQILLPQILCRTAHIHLLYHTQQDHLLPDFYPMPQLLGHVNLACSVGLGLVLK
jgi:hypothetical protein